jgi:transposase
MVDTETGEFTEKTLGHEGNVVREFYAALESRVVVGIEATGAMQWFLELLEELGIECRVGHPAEIRAAETRKQKHDRRDARLLLDLLVMEDRFPEIWMPSTEQRDLRTLLRDRHQWVKMRARLQHTLQAIALNHALRQGHALWSAAGQSALQALPLPAYTSQRRTELLRLYVQLQKRIQELDKEVDAQARQRPQACRLLTHPGVGAVTALATEVFLGDPSRFATGNQVASYSGMIPCEHSSGKRQLWIFRVISRRCLRFISCQLFSGGRQIAFLFFSGCSDFMLIFHGEFNSARPGWRPLHSLSIGVGPLFFSDQPRRHLHNRQYRSHAPLSGRNAPETLCGLSCRALLCLRF